MLGQALIFGPDNEPRGGVSHSERKQVRGVACFQGVCFGTLKPKVALFRVDEFINAGWCLSLRVSFLIAWQARSRKVLPEEWKS